MYASLSIGDAVSRLREYIGKGQYNLTPKEAAPFLCTTPEAICKSALDGTFGLPYCRCGTHTHISAVGVLRYICGGDMPKDLINWGKPA